VGLPEGFYLVGQALNHQYGFALPFHLRSHQLQE